MSEGFLAGAVGIEPTTKVLETSVIPFHHAPVGARKYNVEQCLEQDCVAPLFD